MYKKELGGGIKEDMIEKDLRFLLNIITHKNYYKIQEEIYDIIKNNIIYQKIFIDILFQKAITEKLYVKLYLKVAKYLDKVWPQKLKEKKKKKKKKAPSVVRVYLLDKCKILFKNEKIEQFDEYIKEKNPEERIYKLKILIIGNINLITELMEIKILSLKVGPSCFNNLYDRYIKNEDDKIMKNLTFEALILFLENYCKMLFQKKFLEEKIKEELKSKIEDLFQKIIKIKENLDIPWHIKYRIINLEEKIKKDFVPSELEMPHDYNRGEEVIYDEYEGKITQDDINQKIKKELTNYEKYIENKYENENDDLWEQSTNILEKRKNFGKTFGDILEGYFISASQILEYKKNPKYLKDYILELTEFYFNNLKEKEKTKLKNRLFKLFEVIVELSLDTPYILDIYAYVINIFIEHEMMKLNDLSELEIGETNISQINHVLKHLSKYYKKKDFKMLLETLPFVNNNKKLFEWAFT